MKHYILPLLVAFATLCGCSNIVTSSDEYREPHYNEVENMHIEWNDLFNQSQDNYYVYVYSVACTACSMLREDMVKFAKKEGQHFYFIYPSDDITFTDDEDVADASIGATSIENVNIYTTPTLMEITNKTVTYYSRDYYQIKALIEQ